MRRRLVLSIAAVAALAVVLFAVPLALVLERTYRDEELLRLQRDTVAATREVDVAPGAGDPVELPSSRDGLAVYDVRGRRVAGRAGPALADDVVRDALRGRGPAERTGRGLLVVAIPLVTDERVTGAIRAQRDDARAIRSTRDQWRLLIGAAAAAIALAIVAAALLGRRLARPLELLAVSARRLGEGDFTVRSPPSGVPEVDDVAAALDIAGARLAELVGRERAFTADASHQLRTPLAALRIELEAIELRGEPPAELAAALVQVERLQSTIDTLLAIARDAPRSGARTPLAAVLDEAETRWRAPLAEQGRPLAVRLDDLGLEVGVPAGVVREILDVLLDNALRHGTGTVDVRARSLGDSVVLAVADDGTGQGLDAERIFERRSGAAGGHGIGLALARSLAHAEGGRLVLTRTAPPEFSVFMPAAGARRRDGPERGRRDDG